MAEKALMVGYTDDKSISCIECKDKLGKPVCPIFRAELEKITKCKFCKKELD
jgi:hypothetical protein